MIYMPQFYQDKSKYDSRLRQGDIFDGLVSATIVYDKKDKKPEPNGGGHVDDNCPISEFITKEQTELCMKISDNLLVLITPCCNIPKDDALLFCPLINVHNRIVDHPNLKSNPKLVNELLPPEIAEYPEKWNALPDDKKQKKKEKGLGYAFESWFYFDVDGEILKKPYAINFTRTFSIRQPISFGTPPDKLVKYRVLQLSDETRGLLSTKLSYYYTNNTEE
jgi:hypothetical protein